MYEITCLIILKLQLCCWVGAKRKNTFTLALNFKLLHWPMPHWLLKVLVLDNTTSKQQAAQKGSGLSTEIYNTGQWRAFNVPITTAPTILHINFRSQSHSEPPLDLKIIHNKSSVSSEILQDYSRISSSSLHYFLDNYSSMHFWAVTNPSSPKNSRLLFWI